MWQGLIEPTTSLQEMRERKAQLEAFHDLFEWRRVDTGSFCRSWDGLSLTIFEKNGRFLWCISDDVEDRQRYSKKRFDSEREAMDSLAAELLSTAAENQE